jgi:hypothetical protein
MHAWPKLHATLTSATNACMVQHLKRVSEHGFGWMDGM